jgi:NitT/TauT family transport system substrate-binding protein
METGKHMKTKTIVNVFSSILVLIIAVAVVGCTRDKKPEPPELVTRVTLQQEWFPQANYAGALVAADEFATNNGLEIVIQPGGGDGVDPVLLVSSGQRDFGDAAADKVLIAIEKRKADLVIIGVVNIDSPTCFLAKTEKHISTPKDFENHTVGVLSGTATEYVYRTLCAKQHLDKTKIKEVEASFELPTFISGQYDVRPAFIYDEPVSLDLQGITYSTIEPKIYGVKFLGTVYFTTGKNVREHRDKVQRFIDSIADGWRLALKYPDRAIQLLKRFDKNVDEKRELLSLQKGHPYFEGKNGKVLLSDLSDWQEMVGELKAQGAIGDIDLSAAIDNRFIQDYHRRLEEQKH